MYIIYAVWIPLILHEILLAFLDSFEYDRS